PKKKWEEELQFIPKTNGSHGFLVFETCSLIATVSLITLTRFVISSSPPFVYGGCTGIHGMAIEHTSDSLFLLYLIAKGHP
ncbi:MAG: hypothetical protein ACJ70R_05875, partial [Nitrososphaera sp.]